MEQDDFKDYMDQQIIEIEKYKESQLKNCSHIDTNKCVFEWIRKNAADFRKKWYKKMESC